MSLEQKKLLKEVLEDYDLNKIFETIYDNDLDYETVINDVKDIINTHIKASTKKNDIVEETLGEDLKFIDDMNQKERALYKENKKKKGK